MEYLQNQRMREIHARESETFITGIEDNFSRPTHKTGSVVYYGVRNCPGKLKFLSRKTRKRNNDYSSR